jgi:hypothetical protein
MASQTFLGRCPRLAKRMGFQPERWIPNRQCDVCSRGSGACRLGVTAFVPTCIPRIGHSKFGQPQHKTHKIRFASFGLKAHTFGQPRATP